MSEAVGLERPVGSPEGEHVRAVEVCAGEEAMGFVPVGASEQGIGEEIAGSAGEGVGWGGRGTAEKGIVVATVVEGKGMLGWGSEDLLGRGESAVVVAMGSYWVMDQADADVVVGVTVAAGVVSMSPRCPCWAFRYRWLAVDSPLKGAAVLRTFWWVHWRLDCQIRIKRAMDNLLARPSLVILDMAVLLRISIILFTVDVVVS